MVSTRPLFRRRLTELGAPSAIFPKQSDKMHVHAQAAAGASGGAAPGSATHSSSSTSSPAGRSTRSDSVNSGVGLVTTDSPLLAPVSGEVSVGGMLIALIALLQTGHPRDRKAELGFHLCIR